MIVVGSVVSNPVTEVGVNDRQEEVFDWILRDVIAFASVRELFKLIERHRRFLCGDFKPPIVNYSLKTYPEHK